MPAVVIATNNPKKLKEIRAILEQIRPGLRILTAADVSLGEPEESGLTFRDNALIKAEAAFALTRAICIADDSGLDVDALGGAPGVHSARFAGEGASDADNNAKLLRALEGVPAELRSARYRCVIALIAPVPEPGGAVYRVTVDGACEGRVLDAPAGRGGFGYDPYILYEPAGLTFAELDPDEKHRVSHRGQALRALEPHLRAVLAG